VERRWDLHCIHHVQCASPPPFFSRFVVFFANFGCLIDRCDLSVHVLVPDGTMGPVEVVEVAEEVHSDA
jgi:hypothetical protein